MHHKSVLVFAVILFLLSTPAFTFASTITHTLTKGSSGADVLALQQFLVTQGYLTTTPNGTYGPATIKAVRAFQAAHGLTSTGSVGTQTLALMQSLTGGVSTTAPTPATLTTTTNASGLVTQAQLQQAVNAAIQQTLDSVHQQLYGATSTMAGGGLWGAIAASQKINNLQGVTISGAQVNGVSGLTASDIPALPYLPLSGGTLTGSTTIPGLKLSNILGSSQCLHTDANGNVTGTGADCGVGGGGLLPQNNLSDLISTSTARTNLGLGSIATQAANAVAITGGSITSLGTFSVGTSISLGTAVAAGGNTTISTPNGSNINISPQGTASIKLNATTTVTGALSTGNVTLPQTNNIALSSIFSPNVNLNGTITNAGIAGWTHWTVNSDTASAPQMISDIQIDHNFGGAGYSGGRVGILTNLIQTGAVANGGIIEGGQNSVTLNNSFGGTGLTPSTAKGSATAFNPFLSFGSGYVNGGGGSGIEVDVAANTGSSYLSSSGMLIVHTSSNAVSGSMEDVAEKISDQGGSTAPWKSIFEVGGRGGLWPLSTTAGTVLRGELGYNYNSSPSSAFRGIDLLLPTFSDSAFRSQGFVVSGTGAVSVGRGTISDTGNGLNISSGGEVGAFSSIASAGSSWPTDGNTYYATDAYGGVYLLTLSGGSVASVTLYRAPVVTGVAPSNPVTLSPDMMAKTWGATGLSVNLTWTNATTLSFSSGNNASSVVIGPSSVQLGLSGTSGIPVVSVGAQIDGSGVRQSLGATYIVPANTSLVRFTQGTTVSASTVTLPTALADGQSIQFSNYAGSITSLTFSPTVNGWTNGSTLNAYTGMRVRWDATASAWYREE